jgi:[acyl-carrier-protein] S-malonyltransferase
MTIVFMFPGQSSRYPEMIEKLTSVDGESAAIVERASTVLGRDLAAHFRASNSDVLANNRDVQIGVFLANHLHCAALERLGVRAALSLGLSLGEYNHLVHINALTFDDALRLVDERGALYDRADGGLMVSLFPIEASLVEGTIDRLGLGDRVSVGLYNSPRQQVLSGERSAVEQVVAALDEAVLVDATVIEPRIPMHAPVFKDTGDALARVLARTTFSAPRIPYVPNVRGAIVDDATPDIIRACLTEHAYRSVRWQASIDAIAARHSDARFVEVGPKSVLYNLFGRGWSPGARHRTDVNDAWPAHLHALAEELRRGS